MPLYEYRCRECNTVFEALVTSSQQNREKTSCPRCGSQAITKLLSASALRIGGNSSPFPSSGGGSCNPGSGFS